MIPLEKRLVGLPALLAVIILIGLSGCTNKFNQTGSWLVAADSSLIPKTFDSDSLKVKITSSKLYLGLPNGSDTVHCLGAIPWSEADMLIEFYNLDSVYYATKIVSAQVVMRRATYNLQPPGYNVQNMQLQGYAIDSSWTSSTFTWDSVSRLPRESSNMILSPTIPLVTDSAVAFQIDTGVVRTWANATNDTNYKNYGFIIKPSNISGILSIYSIYSGTGLSPSLVVACIINGVPDTVVSTSTYSTYVANTSVVAPPQTFALQSGTGIHANIVFNMDSIRSASKLDSIPLFSIVNYALLTLHEDPIDSIYSGGSPDSLGVLSDGSLDTRC